MKKRKATRDNTISPRVLACISEGPKTTAELIERGFHRGSVTGVVRRLRDEGKIRQEAKGKPWRTNGPAVSPLREEDVPADRAHPPTARTRRPRAEAPELGRQHPLVAPLYEQRDRIDHAIRVLEGRD